MGTRFWLLSSDELIPIGQNGRRKAKDALKHGPLGSSGVSSATTRGSAGMSECDPTRIWFISLRIMTM